MNNRGITFQAIQQRKFTLFMVLITLIIGLNSYQLLPRQENPDMTVPGAQIFVVYPGASPSEVEVFVTDVIEEALTEVEGYDFTESVTRSGMSVVMFMLKEGIDPKEPFEELRDVMADLRDELPSGVAQIVVNTDIMETPGMIIAMTGDNYSYEELADYADYFRGDLASVRGVTRFDVYGDVDKELDIQVDHEMLAYYNMSINDIIQIINSQNINMPTGAIESDNARIEVTVDSQFERISEIEDLVLLSMGDGRQVRLKDIAKVSYQNNPNDPTFSRNGEKTVFLAGFFERSLNIVTVGQDVEARLDELQTMLPDDIEFSMLSYQPHDVERSTNNFMISLSQAIGFVILVVFLGMGWRNAVVVSTVMPLSIGMTLITMYGLGVPLEQMSISGLIIALGMLVDNAIVVSDSIQIRLDEGQDRIQAAVEGTRSVAFPVLTSTLTTVFAFSPLLLMNSSLGAFIRGVPFVVTVALIASYICSLVTTPVIAVLVFKKSRGDVERNSIIKRLFIGTLTRSLNRRWVAIVASVLFIVVSMGSVGNMEATIFPKADKTLLQIDLTSEFATDIGKTEELKNQTVELLSDIPELTEYYASVGSNLPKFYFTVMFRGESPDIAQLAYTFDLTDSESFATKEELQAYVQEHLQENLVGGTVNAALLDLGAFARDIEFRVFSEDLEALDNARYAMRSFMMSQEGTANIADDFASREYQFRVEVDEVKASYLGFSKFDIQREVTAALMGLHANTYHNNVNEVPIIISSDIDTKEELENLTIRSMVSGQSILLKDLADIEMVSEYPVINHYRDDRVMRMSANVEDGYDVAVIEQALRDFSESPEFDGVVFDFDGIQARMGEMMGDLGRLAVLANFLILSVLILQFSSYRKPLVILASIPLAMSSALLGLYLTGQNLSFVAMLSLLALMGIVVNNAIVLIDCIDEMMAAGMSVRDACVAAVNRRYRPIVLSTTTTVIGLVPLLISGGDLFRPLAIALMSGLSVSTILTMVVIPTIYSLVIRERNEAPEVTEELVVETV